MSKELTPLEAKVESIILKKPTLQKLYIADDETIETIVIKGKEYKCTDIIKQDEVLRIIKEKSVDVNRIQATTKVGEYNFWRLSTLTKEEYDLLKEVLL